MLSIIICSVDDAKFLAVSQMYSRLLIGSAFEIVRIADARGLAEGYNRGIARSRGEVLIFSHDDVRILCADFRQRLMGHMEHCDLLGVAGTTLLCDARWFDSGPPYIYGQIIHPGGEAGEFETAMYGAPSRRINGMQALDGVFLCCKRDVAQSVGFDEQTFAGFHLYDIDFSFRAYCAGYKLAVAADLDLFHESVGKRGPEWRADAERFRQKHAAALARMPPIKFFSSAVRIFGLEEALRLLRPPHWKD